MDSKDLIEEMDRLKAFTDAAAAEIERACAVMEDDGPEALRDHLAGGFPAFERLELEIVAVASRIPAGTETMDAVMRALGRQAELVALLLERTGNLPRAQ